MLTWNVKLKFFCNASVFWQYVMLAAKHESTKHLSSILHMILTSKKTYKELMDPFSRETTITIENQKNEQLFKVFWNCHKGRQQMKKHSKPWLNFIKNSDSAAVEPSSPYISSQLSDSDKGTAFGGCCQEDWSPSTNSPHSSLLYSPGKGSPAAFLTHSSTLYCKSLTPGA